MIKSQFDYYTRQWCVDRAIAILETQSYTEGDVTRVAGTLLAFLYGEK